ncbi:hypothetical protein PsYK624_031750 [Phanerochaete sordida]|uniref:Uncharacterized protein n=1 Tax=Phanerochaete sordida TaxID=48140 RepID=A0A9P3G2U9_9APHY|nr:hypothetical protein PsYK624_031750 [Phanerochaete sordida]
MMRHQHQHSLQRTCLPGIVCTFLGLLQRHEASLRSLHDSHEAGPPTFRAPKFGHRASKQETKSRRQCTLLDDARRTLQGVRAPPSRRASRPLWEPHRRAFWPRAQPRYRPRARWHAVGPGSASGLARRPICRRARGHMAQGVSGGVRRGRGKAARSAPVRKIASFVDVRRVR